MDQVQSSYNTWLAYPQPRKIKILRIVASVCFVLFLFIFVIYAFGGTTTKKKDKHGVVIFMEVLPSSVQALRYLLQRRDAQVLMIVLTVNSWSSNLVAANTNLRYFEHLLHAEGLQGELRVTYGQSVAAIDADFVASINYQTDSSSAAIPITCTYQRVLKETLLAAADTMFGAVKEQLNDTLPDYFDAPLASLMAKRSASFLVLGPATDAAYFVKEHPDLRKRITELTVAGGTFFAVADAQRVYSPNNNAEINFFFDPLAAKYLVQGSHGIPVTLLPLDASCAWSERMNSIYSSPSTNSSASFIGRSVEGYFQALKVVGTQRRLGVEMLAAVYLVDGQLRGQAEVTKFPGDVVSGVSMILDGKSYHSGTNPFRADVKAVLRMRCDAVDANVEEVSHFAF